MKTCYLELTDKAGWNGNSPQLKYENILHRQFITSLLPYPYDKTSFFEVSDVDFLNLKNILPEGLTIKEVKTNGINMNEFILKYLNLNNELLTIEEKRDSILSTITPNEGNKNDTSFLFKKFYGNTY